VTRFRPHRDRSVEALPIVQAGPAAMRAPEVTARPLTTIPREPVAGALDDPGTPDARHDALAIVAAAAVRGDPVALRTLLTTLMPQLLRVVRRVLGPGHSDLEDVAFEAAHAVLEGLPRFRGEGSLRHYACRVAAYTAMNVHRREATTKRAHGTEGIDVDRVAAGGPGPEQQALTAALAPIVRELVATLPAPLAEALTLHVILGYTVDEIAHANGIPPETVRSRLRLARRALRRRVLGSPALVEALEVEP